MWWRFVAAVAVLQAGCEGAVDQSPACAQYVQCVQAMDTAANQTTDLDRYDIGGSCWGGPQIAKLCTRSCERGLQREQRDPAAPTECQP